MARLEGSDDAIRVHQRANAARVDSSANGSLAGGSDWDETFDSAQYIRSLARGASSQEC
jgi:hypothetical protein